MVKNLKIGKAHILETGNKFGNMNSAKQFYPEDYTLEQRKEEFLKHRMAAGEYYGFDGHKMFMADQNDKSGSWFELTDEYVRNNPNGWTDIPQDILIVTDKVPGVVIGHPVADCPVVMAFDKKNGVAAIGHCSADLVDKRMPMLIVDALLQSHNVSDDDVAMYVSACAGKSWTYDRYPSWAKDDKLWEDAITEDKNGLFHIDLRKAVLKQLKERNVNDIMVSSVDTIVDPNFYSNSAAFHGDEDKKGRNFAGTFIEDSRKTR